MTLPEHAAVIEEFGKVFDGLPPQWCPDCHTLGYGFGEEDRICGNCNGTQVCAFAAFLRIAIAQAEQRGREEACGNIQKAIGYMAYTDYNFGKAVFCAIDKARNPHQ